MDLGWVLSVSGITSRSPTGFAHVSVHSVHAYQPFQRRAASQTQVRVVPVHTVDWRQEEEQEPVCSPAGALMERGENKFSTWLA